MTSEELGVVSQVAEKYGKGRVHLTTRQAVEIHNIHVDNLQAAREELEQSGLVLGVCGPRGRGIVACPGNATCTSGIIETKELAAELDAEYLRIPAPHKFKIGISGCPNNCSKPVENDIGIMGGVLPGWDKEACIACKLCVSICPAQAIEQREKDFVLDTEKCILCGLCISNCPSSAWKAQEDRLYAVPRRDHGQEAAARDQGKGADRDKRGTERVHQTGLRLSTSPRAGKRSASATPSTGSGWTRLLPGYSRQRKRAPPQPRKMMHHPL